MADDLEKERLGDILIQRKLITPKQLDQAVQCQVLFGGRLGTNFLECGYISEADLLSVLAEKYRVPSVGMSDLLDIPNKVIDLIPVNLADKYQVLPLSLTDERLTVAFMDPWKESTLKVLESKTGKKIYPSVGLEVHVRWAMERYYGIKRDARFINLERTLKSRDVQPEGLKEASDQTTPAPRSPGDTFFDLSEALPPLPTEPILPDSNDITSLEGAPLSLEDFWDRVGRTQMPSYLLPRITREIGEADNRDQIAEIIMDFAGRLLLRTALFFIKDGIVFGWDGRGVKLSREQVQGIMIPLDLPSVFQTVVQTGAFLLGPIAGIPINRRFLAAMGSIEPASAVLIPLSIDNRVVAILYGDNGPGREAPENLHELQSVLREATNALRKLIQQQKASNPKDQESSG